MLIELQFTYFFNAYPAAGKTALCWKVLPNVQECDARKAL